MSADSYYDPPSPAAEREVDAYCNACESDQLCLEIRWTFGTTTRECRGCGEVTEMEGDE